MEKESHLELNNESSTFLRYMAILASRMDEDFEFDEARAMIKLSNNWIAEARNQEDLNSRLHMSTYLIMSALAPTIEAYREKGEKPKLVKEYDDIERLFHSCDVVTVMTRQEGTDSHREIRVSVSTTNKDSEQSRPMLKQLPASEMLCNVEDLPIALEAQKENGYRRINCGAMAQYRRALKLAYLVGYLDPEEKVEIRGDAARAQDLRNEEGKLRRRD